MREAASKSRRGATLLETVVVTGLFISLLFSMLSMGMTATTNWADTTVKVTAEDDASLGLQRLARDIRDGMRAWVEQGADLYVVMPLANAEGDFSTMDEGDTVRYYVEGGRLYRRLGDNAATVVAERVQSARFIVEGSVVDLTLTCAQQHGSRKGTTTLRTRVNLRNEAPQ